MTSMVQGAAKSAGTVHVDPDVRKTVFVPVSVVGDPVIV
jgi:hypothetical protein